MSLRRLGVDRLDLYQLHRVDPQVPLADTLGAVSELQEAGKIRHVGLSEADVAEIEEAREIVDVVSVQNRYHVADRGWERVLDHCEAEGIAFIAWGSLGSGGGDLSALGPLDDVAGLDGWTGSAARRRSARGPPARC